MKENQRVLYIAIGCDTDPDRRGFLDTTPAEGLAWRGMTEGIPRMKEALADLVDRDGRPPILTWLLRVDDQIRQVHGDYAWVPRTHRDFLMSLEASGDELGWHPHFWRFNETTRRWYQELADIDWQVDMLRAAHAAYEEAMPGRTRSVRMGWAYHNNRTYRTLADLGAAIEHSANPGLRTLTRTASKRDENMFDWYPTPRGPYLPSQDDYRRPPRAGEKTVNLLEWPITTSGSFVYGLVAGLQLARKMKDPIQLYQALRRPSFIINITGRPSLFRPILTAVRRTITRNQSQPMVFATYLHADELLDNKSAIYSLANMRDNLHAVHRLCRETKVEVVHTQVHRLRALYKD